MVFDVVLERYVGWCMVQNVVCDALHDVVLYWFMMWYVTWCVMGYDMVHANVGDMVGGMVCDGV